MRIFTSKLDSRLASMSSDFTLPGYVAEKLQEHVGIDDATFSIQQGSRNGDSYSSDIYRLTMLEKRKPIASFILKMAPDTEHRRALSKTSEQFACEYRVYSSVLPELERFQREHPRKPEVFRNYARMICGSTIEKQEFILMQDLAAQNFTSFDRPVPLGFEYCEAVCKVLAHLHAISFAYKDQDPEKFVELVKPFKEIVFEDDSHDINMFLEQRIEPAMKTLGAADDDVKRRLTEYKDVICESMRDCIREKDHAVVLHGDCWISNLLYRKKEDGADIDIALLDWQICRYGTPVIDLSYFIFCCTDVTLRTRLSELFDIYYCSLSKRIVALGSDPAVVYPLDVFQTHIRKYMKFGFGMSLMSTHSTTCNPKDLPNVIDVLNKGDYETFNALSDIMSESEAYKERMAGICRDVVRFGYI